MKWCIEPVWRTPIILQKSHPISSDGIFLFASPFVWECIRYRVSFAILESENLILIYHEYILVWSRWFDSLSSEVSIEPPLIWDDISSSTLHIEIPPCSIARYEPTVIHDTDLFPISHEEYAISDLFSCFVISYCEYLALMFIESDSALRLPWRYIASP